MSINGALFLLGLDSPCQPRLLAVSDFQNAAHSINGISKTVDEMWYHDPVWGPWSTDFIIPGTGIVATKYNTSYQVVAPVATTELNAAIDNEYTVVVDYEFESTDDSKTICVLNITATTLPHESTAWWCITQQSGIDNPIFQGTGMGDFAGVDVETPQFGLGSHRIAVTFSQAKIMHCADGGTVRSTMHELQANIPNHFMIGPEANTLGQGGNGTTVTVTIRKITFYSLVTDPVILKQLSV